MKTNIFWALLCNEILCWAVISNGDHVPGFDFQHKACSGFDLEKNVMVCDYNEHYVSGSD